MGLIGFYCVLLVACFFFFSHALECYVCTNQEAISEKCLKSIKTCEQGQDTCFTEIKWGGTPYWSRGAKRQLYVSKRCSTKQECEKIKENNMNDCTYIWYQDWKCSDCCQGDKCNDYVIIKQCFGMELSGFYWVLLIACFSSFSHAMRCYVCTNQEGNNERCLNNIRTCGQGQDTCITETNWDSAKRQLYVTKKCSTKRECETRKQHNMRECTYISNQNWKCSDCCQGDKCNYHVKSAA